MNLTIMMTIAAATPYIPSTPSLGVAEARCRQNEPGPAIIVDVAGLRDRQGRLKLEAYPSNDADFLADDNVLIMAGKVFRRVERPLPAAGDVQAVHTRAGAGVIQPLPSPRPGRQPAVRPFLRRHRVSEQSEAGPVPAERGRHQGGGGPRADPNPDRDELPPRTLLQAPGAVIP